MKELKTLQSSFITSLPRSRATRRAEKIDRYFDFKQSELYELLEVYRFLYKHSCRLYRIVFLIAARGDSLLASLIGTLRRSQLRGIGAFLGLGRIPAPSMALRISIKAPGSAAVCWARGRTLVAEQKRKAGRGDRISC